MRSLRALAHAVWRASCRKDGREDDIARGVREPSADAHRGQPTRGHVCRRSASRGASFSFGGLEQTRQAYRERGTMPFVENLLYDIRYTLRQCRREPTFAVTVALVLALGIGASAAIFSVVNPILFRPLPYPGAERIMMMWENRRADKPMYVAFATFYGLKDRIRSLESMAVMQPWQPAMIGGGEPERLEGQLVSSSYFQTLGVLPALGRSFVAADDQFHGPNNEIPAMHYGGGALPAMRRSSAARSRSATILTP